MFIKSLYKIIGLNLGIIVSFILIPFLFSYAENNEKVEEKTDKLHIEDSRPAVSSAAYTPEEVRHVQTLLTFLDFNPGPIDGLFGQKTSSAIRSFQSDIGVPVTGIIDGNLKSQLDDAYQSLIDRNQKRSEANKSKPREGNEKSEQVKAPDNRTNLR